jgi:hypothetical protein
VAVLLKSAQPFFEYCRAFQAEDEAVEIKPGIEVEAERKRYEFKDELKATEVEAARQSGSSSVVLARYGKLVEAWKNLFHCVVEAVCGMM